MIKKKPFNKKKNCANFFIKFLYTKNIIKIFQFNKSIRIIKEKIITPNKK